MIGTASVEPELLSQAMRCLERARDVAGVHRGEIRRIEEDAAGRQFFDDMAQQGGGERDVVPACDERVDLADIDAGIGHHRLHRVQALFGVGWCSA